MTCYEELEKRGLVHQSTDPEKVKELINEGKAVIYVGFDPSADSLHIGNLLQLITLKRLQKAGNRVIALIGGVTGLIGDPSGKSEERNLLSSERVAHNCSSIENQIKGFLDQDTTTFVNNNDWLAKIDFISFLRDVGKYFSVNDMIKRDSVSARLNREGAGISYTEFSYMLLQAYDFYYLAENHGCNLQMGGSDQWGNIVSGIDLTRRKLGKESFGLTLPLLLDNKGQKLGKTEKGALWLSSEKLSPYAFYQYWINRSDEEARYLLPMLSSYEVSWIEELVADETALSQRKMQKALAYDLTLVVHGEDDAKRCQKATEVLFSGADASELDEKSLSWLWDEIPNCSIATGETGVMDILVGAGLCASKSAAKRDIKQGGLKINDQKVDDPFSDISALPSLAGNYFLIKKGKKSFALARL